MIKKMSDNDTNAKFPELVAYLDGELTTDERAEIEGRLASDKEYRGELAELQRTWDLLDALPPVVASESFTQSTIEMVALKASAPTSPRAAPIRWLRFIAVVVLMLVPIAAFYFGYWNTQKDLNANNRQTLDDIPIYENLELYRSVNAELDVEGAMKFLELLVETETVFFDFDESDVEEADSEQDSSVQLVSSVKSSGPISDEKMQDLLYRQRQFENLESGDGGPSQAESLRKFHQQITNHPNSDSLFTSLRKFREWLRNKGYRGQEVIDTIMDFSPAERVAEIKRMEEKDFEDRYSRSFSSDVPAISPSPKDVALINRIANDWSNSYMMRVLEHLMSNSTPERISEIEAKLDAAPTEHHYRAILMMEGRRGVRISPPRISNEENIKKFIAGLSEESKEKLSWLSEEVQAEVVQMWIGIALFRVKDSDLFEFYDNGLNGKQRNSLKSVDAPRRKELLIKAFRQTLFQRSIPEEDLTELINKESKSDNEEGSAKPKSSARPKKKLDGA